MTSPRKVLLLSPARDGDYYISVQPPLGILYLASTLRKNEIPVRVLDLKTHKQWELLLNRTLLEFQPDIVGITANVFNRRAALQLATLLKQNHPKLILVVGGPQATAVPEDFQNGPFDYLIPYEGEVPFLDFVKASDPGHSSGAVSCHGVDFMERFRNISPQLVPNLDSLPPPAYDLIDCAPYFINSYRARPLVSMITSRGCPASCVFCSQAVSGRKWRSRSPENIVAEMLALQNAGIKEISIEDDNFSLDISRAIALCKLMRERNVNLHWQLANGIRADLVTFELLKEMKAAGCWKLALAPEVGDDDLRRTICKGISSKRFLEVARWCKELKIVFYGFFLIGFPFDTPKSVQKTVAFAMELDPLIMDLSKLLPFKGTPIYSSIKASDSGQEKSSNYYNYLNAGWIDPAYRNAYLRFYLRPKKLYNIIRVIGLRSFFRLVKYGFDVFVKPQKTETSGQN